MNLFKKKSGSDIQLQKKWESAWEKAVSLWSRFTRLSPPRWCFSQGQEKKEGLLGSFAMIRLKDHAVVVSLRQIKKLGLDDFALQILAHEIGHHVLAPADLTDNGRLMARVRSQLPEKEHLAGYVANLYTDLLINNRLQGSFGLDMAAVYKALKVKDKDPLWNLYMRIYELLWGLESKTLCFEAPKGAMAGDAHLGARLIRVYAKQWLDGAGRFAALCLPYLMENNGVSLKKIMIPLLDADRAGAGGTVPDGLVEMDEAESGESLHPALDPNLNEGLENSGEENGKKSTPAPGGRAIVGGRKNQYRDPGTYRELLESLGVSLDPQQAAVHYYRERALPHLISFPRMKAPKAYDPLPEGEEPWDLGSPLSKVDWFSTLAKSPHVIPGVTTVQQVYGKSPGNDPEIAPVDLYLGIDCSGSMPNPAYLISYPVLAGAIMALSALRAGAKVMTVLSGEPGKFSATNGFVRDESEILKHLTGYLGTGYAFGIQRLQDAFSTKAAHKTHILVITDSDIFHMLKDTKNGWKIAEDALEAAGGGGTFALHRVSREHRDAKRMLDAGWDVHTIDEWESLIRFAREFSKKTWEKPG